MLARKCPRSRDFSIDDIRGYHYQATALAV